MFNPRALTQLTSLLALSCATTPGSSPHEMSTAQHEATARREETTASGHEAQYDPNATLTRERCGPHARAAFRPDLAFAACWTSVTNPTEAHRRTAEEHRRHAAAHRAGSSGLREAEARACAGIAPEDRDLSPFEHPEDLASVTPLQLPAGGSASIQGAVVTFRPVPGMTVEWLQRAVDCHLARNASLGHAVPEMPDCPLVPNGASAKVSATGEGFAVAIRADDPASARDILERAQRLLGWRNRVSSRQ